MCVAVGLAFVEYHYETGNNLMLTFNKLSYNNEPNYLKDISLDYSLYYENKVQLKEIPYGTTLEDLVDIYGDYESHYEDLTYTWSLSDNVKLTVMTFNSEYRTDLPKDIIYGIDVSFKNN